MNPPQPTALHPEQAVPPLSQTQLRPPVGGRDAIPDAQSSVPMKYLHVVTPDGHQACFELPNRSQLFLSQGGESPNESNPGPRPPNPAGSGRTGRKVACINCRNAAKRCDEGRPCARCLRLDLQGCVDAPTKQGRPTLNGHWQGELPTQTLIHSKTTFIEEQRQHWQQVAYDPVSGAAWSTFTSKGIRSASTSVETQFVAPSGPPPVYHAQPAGTYSAPSTSQADMLNVVEPQYQFPGNLAQAPAHSRVAAMPSAPAPPQAMSYNYPAHGQAPPYCYPPGGAPQFDTRQPGSFHSTGQTYPNTGPTVDPRFHYQGGGNDEMWSFT